VGLFTVLAAHDMQSSSTYCAVGAHYSCCYTRARVRNNSIGTSSHSNATERQLFTVTDLRLILLACNCIYDITILLSLVCCVLLQLCYDVLYYATDTTMLAATTVCLIIYTAHACMLLLYLCYTV
jgi:hypothetical protein